jgi:hypothetical protein
LILLRARFISLMLLATFICVSVSSCVTVMNWLSGSSVDQINEIPSRRHNALNGAQFGRLLRKGVVSARERNIMAQAFAGNVPDHVRRLNPILITKRLKNGKKVQAKIFVSSDYFSIGSNQRYLRIPMTPMTAQVIADRFHLVIPTRKMVKLIYENAAVKLRPRPMPPGKAMASIDYYEAHNQTIQGQLVGKDINQLIAGHKKDVVNTRKLLGRPKQVAIYGWHRRSGKAIQPLSLVHVNTYADYSHGVRYVRDKMEVDGKMMSIRDVLQHPYLHELISDEGVVTSEKVPTKSHPMSMDKFHSSQI